MRTCCLRNLRKGGLSPSDLVSVYCSTILSVLKYASPEWVALPVYLSDLLEQVQRKALYIVFPDLCYSDALHLADLELLSDRRRQACMNFATNCHESGTLSSLFRVPMVNYHGCNLRSGSQSYHASSGKCKRFNDFVTVKFQNVSRDRTL